MRVAPISLSSSVLELSRLDELPVLGAPGLDACIVRRPLAPALSQALDVLVGGPTFHHGSVITRGATSPRALFPELPRWPAADFLRGDAMRIGMAWLELTGRAHARLELSIVETDACRKLHADYVDVRFVCTYVGPGTELFDHAGLDRAALERDDEPEVANPRIRGTARVVHAHAGDVVAMKGRTYPGNEGRGAVHRSPPIAGTGVRRLVLKVDGLGCDC